MSNPAPDEADDSLDPRTLEAIQNLNIIPDMVADARYTGIHSSRDRGGDVEFAEHRQYEPGDDLRHLDWNALAKTDELFLKQYESETQITGRVVLDASQSMDFSTTQFSKWETARAVGVLIASNLINQQDTVHLSTSRPEPWHSDQLKSFVDLKKQIDVLREQEPSGETTLPEDLRRIQSDNPSLWIIISDFWFQELDPFFQHMSGLNERGHDAIIAPVWDPIERVFDVGGNVKLRDVETGETLHVGGKDREKFQSLLQSHRERIQGFAETNGLSFWPFYTDKPLFERYRQFVLSEQP